jgi:hypothetical protein
MEKSEESFIKRLALRMEVAVVVVLLAVGADATLERWRTRRVAVAAKRANADSADSGSA